MVRSTPGTLEWHPERTDVTPVKETPAEIHIRPITTKSAAPSLSRGTTLFRWRK